MTEEARAVMGRSAGQAETLAAAALAAAAAQVRSDESRMRAWPTVRAHAGAIACANWARRVGRDGLESRAELFWGGEGGGFSLYYGLHRYLTSKGHD